MRIFFDHAATTPLDPEVKKVMLEAMDNLPGNPSSIHREGREARSAIEAARKSVARVIGASIGEIFFTSGGTESSNMALKGAVHDLGVERIISSPTEHHCVLHSLDRLSEAGVEVVHLNVDPKGQPDLGRLSSLLQKDPKKTLVSLMHANNEIGTLIDLQAVGSICREQGALFHSDTVQTVGTYPIDVQEIPIDFLTGSAHKFFGPKGVGFIYINSDVQLQPFIDGGAQERNMRAGTENTYGILGLAKALELTVLHREGRKEYVLALKNYLKALLDAAFEDIQYLGDWEFGHYKLLNVSFPPSPKADLLLLNLDMAGISVSGGSACSSGADAGSHVLQALLGEENERKSIRISLSHLNTHEEIDTLLEKLKEILQVPAGI